MKSGKKLMGTLIALCLSLTVLVGCGGQPSESPKQNGEETQRSAPESAENASGSAVEGMDSVSGGGLTVTKDFGTYTVLEGWIEAERYSSQNKMFYVAAGTEDQAQPNNISVEMGTNRYGAEEHESFRHAIVQQLAAQLKNENVTVEGGGSNTDQGLLLYTFTFTYPEESDMKGATATQYYIVGDHRYVLVYETVWGDPEETDRAAKAIVNSFVWSEE